MLYQCQGFTRGIMTYQDANRSAYNLTAREIGQVENMMVDDYNAALKEINRKLRKVYNEILDGVKPDRYYAVMTKYNRLKNLNKEVQAAYLKHARSAGRKIEASSKVAISNAYYRNLYLIEWSGKEVFTLLPDDVIKASVYGTPQEWARIAKDFGEQSKYLPQSGTLLEELIKKRRPQVLADIESGIRQGLIQGEGYRKTARKIRDVMGTDINRALKITRTEGHRNMMQGNYAASQTAKAQGVEMKRQIVSVLDDRTRPQSAQVDGEIENDQGYFQYPGQLVQIPGNSGRPEWDIYDRESVINIIDGVEPTTRRARAPSGPNEGETDIISFKYFDEWAKENGLTRNRYGQLLSK